jgi:uncharacterized protein YndB with AHSA1/START domain
MSETQGYELSITRTFDAPRELVWRAWTDPKMVKQWMGPRGFRCTGFETERKEGLPWHLTMEGKLPEREQFIRLEQLGTTLEVRPPELLKYTFAWGDRSTVGLGPSPYKENVVTVRFEEAGKNRTTVHFHQAPFATEAERNGHNGGWNNALDKFAEFLAAQQPERVADPDEVSTELHMRRTFRAPLQRVFDAFTKPEMVAEWFGPQQFHTRVSEWDARNGGTIRATMIGPDGTEFPMGGKFVEVYPPYRFHFISSGLDKEGKPIFEIWNSVFMEEKDGETTVTLDVHVMSAIEGASQYLKGMREGWKQTLDKLAAFVQQQ